MTGITAIRLMSGDAESLARFYERALGFRREGEAAGTDPFCGRLQKLVTLRLGGERLQLAEPEVSVSHARATPIGTSFQHFAIVASDMAAAIARLRGEPGWTPISRGGPQVLTPASGGVTAFKFRDPEGHPLELLSFSLDAIPARWQGCNGATIGIDHTAIVVAVSEASLAFYGALGFRQTGATLNRGPEQAALDGLRDPVVAVTALAVPEAPPPHLELLCYDGGVPADAVADRDALATRTILAGGGTARRDPDGHHWIVPPD